MDLRRLVLAALLACTAGCIGGQSGTESGGGGKFDGPMVNTVRVPGGCACGLADRPAIALRATVVKVEGMPLRVRLKVRTLLDEGPVEPELRFAPGDEIGGEIDAGCEPALPLHAGDDVAVLHMPGFQAGNECPEYRACASARCEQTPLEGSEAIACDQDCRDQTRTRCASRAGEALLHGRVVIARWGAQLQLPLAMSGTSLRLPVAELPSLLDAKACEALLPDAPQRPDGFGEPPLDGDPISAADGGELGIGSAAAD